MLNTAQAVESTKPDQALIYTVLVHCLGTLSWHTVLAHCLGTLSWPVQSAVIRSCPMKIRNDAIFLLSLKVRAWFREGGA
jgi:hypothetical protein